MNSTVCLHLNTHKKHFQQLLLPQRDPAFTFCCPNSRVWQRSAWLGAMVFSIMTCCWDSVLKVQNRGSFYLSAGSQPATCREGIADKTEIIRWVLDDEEKLKEGGAACGWAPESWVISLWTLHADLGMPCSGSLQEVCCSTGDGKIKLAAKCQATSRLSSYMFTMSMTNI